MSRFSLRVGDDGFTAYLKLPDYPGSAQPKAARTLSLADAIGAYKGPHVVFDFDGDDVLIGIEIVADDPAEDDL